MQQDHGHADDEVDLVIDARCDPLSMINISDEPRNLKKSFMKRYRKSFSTSSSPQQFYTSLGLYRLWNEPQIGCFRFALRTINSTGRAGMTSNLTNPNRIVPQTVDADSSPSPPSSHLSHLNHFHSHHPFHHETPSNQTVRQPGDQSSQATDSTSRDQTNPDGNHQAKKSVEAEKSNRLESAGSKSPPQPPCSVSPTSSTSSAISISSSSSSSVHHLRPSSSGIPSSSSSSGKPSCSPQSSTSLARSSVTPPGSRTNRAGSGGSAGSKQQTNGASQSLPPSPADSGVSDVDSHYSSSTTDESGNRLAKMNQNRSSSSSSPPVKLDQTLKSGDKSNLASGKIKSSPNPDSSSSSNSNTNSNAHSNSNSNELDANRKRQAEAHPNGQGIVGGAKFESQVVCKQQDQQQARNQMEAPKQPVSSSGNEARDSLSQCKYRAEEFWAQRKRMSFST